MGSWLDPLGETLLDASLAALLLSGLVALAMVACRQPARRRVLARAGLLGLLGLWPLVALPPLARVEVLPPVGWFLPAAVWSPTAGRPPRGGYSGGIDRVRRAAVSIRSSLRESPWALRGLTLGYAAGAATGLGFCVLGWWGTRWLQRHSHAPSPSARGVYETQPFARRRRPRLLVAPRLGRPVLVGVVRSTILIPDSLDRPDAAEPLRLGLLHELAHAASDDAAFGSVGSLAQAVWFFLPPVWWIRGQLRLDQEFLADHEASCGFGHCTAYASSLVNLAAPAGPSARGGAGAPAVPSAPHAGASNLFLRVLMLVKRPFPMEPRAPLWWRALLFVGMCCATLGASSLSFRGGEPVCLPATTGTVSEHGNFQMARLIIEADRDSGDPAAPPRRREPYVLPPVLPPRFDLTLEVSATTPNDLSQIRVLNHRLLVPATSSVDWHRSWHRIDVHRDGRAFRFLLDGKPVAARAEGPIPTRLTLEPAPHQPGVYRLLVMTW